MPIIFVERDINKEGAQEACEALEIRYFLTCVVVLGFICVKLQEDEPLRFAHSLCVSYTLVQQLKKIVKNSKGEA